MARRVPTEDDFPEGTDFIIKEFNVPLADVPGKGLINWFGGSPRPYDVKQLKVDNNWPADSFEQWIEVVRASIR